MGADFWPYGADENRTTLEAFMRHHHAQGLSPRIMPVEELFVPSTLERIKI
jgi:4,5-dihydroxyphthalate decarboxylase